MTKNNLKPTDVSKRSVITRWMILATALASFNMVSIPASAQYSYPGPYGNNSSGSIVVFPYHYNHGKFADALGGRARHNRGFDGDWVGEWSNSLGQIGGDSLWLYKGSDGQYSGIWSKAMRISGRQINASTIELHGRTYNRDYVAKATLNKNVLRIEYTSLRLDGRAGSCIGRATFVKRPNS